MCERCGTPLPPDARFCPRCGAWVAQEEEAGEERKVVTVLFADIAGSTRLASRLDPERFREVMGAFYQLASDELASLRGRAEKFVGDAVMAVFGLPHAHDDDALRAVRAGLSIRDRVERLGERLGLADPLTVRVGINTGAVMASMAPADDFLVSGAAVNLAARLQQAAEPGEVLVGETTWLLTRHAASFGESRRVAAKGFPDEPSACPVLSLTPRSSRRTIPLVGRRRELDLVHGAFERAMETSRAHLVTVVGEPGIGKSRLVQELLAGTPEEAVVMFGRASEFGEDPTFAPLVDMIRRRLGVGGETPEQELRARLREVVEGCCDPGDVDRVMAQLGLLLGVGEEDREGTQYRAAEIRAGLVSLVEGLSRSGPVVVVLEDLHLARTPLLQVVEELVREGRRLPLTVVAVAREDLLRERPGWGAGAPDAIVLRLEPLAYRESLDLAAAAAGTPMEDATADRIAREAGGNPFFIVETTGMLLHEADAHTHGGPARTSALPPTVQAVAASRIDHLAEPARNLIRVASIFPGGAFVESKLALVAEANREVLATLEDEELLVRDEEFRERWRFRHELLREVAYDSLPKRERRRLHERVAEGMDELEASERHAQAVAFHLEAAAKAALDLDPADREPARRAEAALRRAGDLARRRMENRAALDLYERALAMAGPQDDWGVEEARILAGMGESRYWLGEYEDAEATLTLSLERAGDDAWARGLAGRFLADITLNIHADIDRAEEMFRGALGAAEELGNPWATARTLLMAGWVGYWREDMSAARRTFEKALRIARENPEKDKWGEARALISLAGVASAESDPVGVLELAESALSLGRELGDPFTIATAQERRSNAFRAMWRLGESLACSSEAVRIYRDLGARWELASALGDRGTVLRLLERYEEAEADLREAYGLCLELGDRVLIAWNASELAITLALRGRLEEARTVADDPALPETSSGPGDRTALLWARTLIGFAEGGTDRALALAQEALTMEREHGNERAAAISVWWIASLFGAEAAGGDEEVGRARKILEEAEWVRAFHEAELVRSALAPVG
jgi:class 3 adenylate cyclase/tetratricopeptide (TPR) repeat protein